MQSSTTEALATIIRDLVMVAEAEDEGSGLLIMASIIVQAAQKVGLGHPGLTATEADDAEFEKILVRKIIKSLQNDQIPATFLSAYQEAL